MGLGNAFKQYIRDAMPGGALNSEITPANTRLAAELAAMTPNPIGDIASVGLAVDDLRKGNYGDAALNGLGLLPFVPAIGGALKPGKYPAHGWNIRGQELKTAVEEMADVMPAGVPDAHQEGVSRLITEIRDRGLLPFTDVDKGGSVYVSAMKPRMNTSGSMNMKSKPDAFGARGYYGGTNPYQVRFSDHGQFYSGPTMSIDPHSGNTTDKAIQFLDSLLGKAERPKIGSSYIIPATGEQGGWGK